MFHFVRRHRRWLRYFPRKKHLRGGRLHRMLGDKVFARELWAPSRQTVAGGLALGLFIGCTPTMGAQVVLGGIAAYFLRMNIPITLAATLITNPFTAAFIYPLEYQLGVWLVGVPEPRELEGYTGMLRNFVRYARPLWIGALVAGAVLAPLGYLFVSLLWKEARHLREVLHREAPPKPAEPPPGSVKQPLPRPPA
jgi:uncharacterized protein (DUF2062 family)